MRNNTQLIPILKRGEQEQWVDARTLHNFLQVGKDFSNWIKDYITDFGFVEGRDFSPNLAKSTGGRQAIEYTITLDMAKHLAMLQRNEKGMQARQYFISAEKELRRLQTSLLSFYDEVQPLLNECYSEEHHGYRWYAVSQLRRLSNKHYCKREKMLQLQEKGLVIKLPHQTATKWFVRKDAVNQVLNVKPGHQLSVAIVNLLQKGGAA